MSIPEIKEYYLLLNENHPIEEFELFSVINGEYAGMDSTKKHNC